LGRLRCLRRAIRAQVVVAAKAAAEDSKPVRGGGGWTGDVCRVKAVRVRVSQIGSLDPICYAPELSQQLGTDAFLGKARCNQTHCTRCSLEPIVV
jgi:hypothetical protein